MFAQRIKKYIGSYMAQLNGTKALIFTGGIGENSITMRQMIMENLEQMGIIFDSEKNKNFKRGVECLVSADNSPIAVYIIPTNEELVIARDTFCIIDGIPCM
jgi:acetate kinase